EFRRVLFRSFWAVVKCPRLEERDGTSKDITDFSPRQYCQITVTRQPDTEGAHGGLGAPSWSRRKRSRGRTPAAGDRRVEPQLMAAVAYAAGTERTVSSARAHQGVHQRTVSCARSRRSPRSRRQAIIPAPPTAYATIIACHRLNRYSVAY